MMLVLSDTSVTTNTRTLPPAREVMKLTSERKGSSREHNDGSTLDGCGSVVANGCVFKALRQVPLCASFVVRDGDLCDLKNRQTKSINFIFRSEQTRTDVGNVANLACNLEIALLVDRVE
jgi:hypothetical protein